MIFKINALISHYLYIPFPEELSDTVWSEKWAQVNFLIDKGIIGTKKE